MDEVAELELPTQENVHADLRSVFQGAVKLALETVLQEVVRDLVGASRWQRLVSRKDVRNGTYLRSLLTTMGLIEVMTVEPWARPENPGRVLLRLRAFPSR